MSVDIFYPAVTTLSAAQALQKALLKPIAARHEEAGIIADALISPAPGSAQVFATDAESAQRLQSVAFMLLHGTITSAQWQAEDGTWYELKRPSEDEFGLSLAAAVADYVQDCRNNAKAICDLIDAAATVAAALAVDLSAGWPSRSVAAVSPLPDKAYDVGTFISGKPTASELVLRHVVTRPFRLPASLTGSQGSAGTAATAQTDFDVKKNGTSLGTVRFAAAAATETLIAASATDFAAGDVLTLVAPATPDATLADIAITLKGIRR